MNVTLIQNTTTFFKEKFDSSPEKIVLSPGRINIIGEHIDYNDGFVLPAAIDKIICFAFEKNNSNQSKIIAIDLNDTVEIDLKSEIKLHKKTWANYLLGVVKQLQDNGFTFGGFNCVFSSNIPVGSGLSSSAALECGFLYGIKELFDLKINPIDIALMGQKAEHWVGINCGIMDQFASVMGKENKVLKIDCKTLEFEYHDADFNDYAVLLLDSNVKHSLFSSAYNQRREECEIGLKLLKKNFPTVTSFRDCNEIQLLSLQDQMTASIFKRCHYVIKEIARVAKACKALDAGEIEVLGQLLYETHDGLSKEYEVSCDELDFLVETTKADKTVIGSRLMGGGFGGCTINLVRKGFEEDLKQRMASLYFEKFAVELKIYDVKISNGTSLYSH